MSAKLCFCYFFVSFLSSLFYLLLLPQRQRVLRSINCGIEYQKRAFGDAGKYEMKLSNSSPSIKFVVAKKADSLYPIVSGASIVAKSYTGCLMRLLKTCRGIFDLDILEVRHVILSHAISPNQVLARGSQNIISLDFQHWSDLVGEPAKDAAEVLWESDNLDEDGGGSNNKNRLSNVGFTTSKRSEEIESSGKGRCRFFQARKLEHLTYSSKMCTRYCVNLINILNIY
ncbi:hypothetical protein JHK82_056111 [Glycine max]|uniref:Ribonuclease n=1 Tax=Glycine max TaxID=3847 RepID=I1NFE4_SOYBN|nr:hypothetical protein JHK86_055937 [Glycine max]KAG5074751.1 hypothetical protein JHK84_055982 [Glycine max]KAG5077416.1 hypothetical protein JHK82_056111 [Glycine max]KAH1035579.1 hypothetical protein GYH30_055520 [Glycine max]